MSDSLKADVLKAVKNNAPVKDGTTVKFKTLQVLQHGFDNAFKSPQNLNENADADVIKTND